MICVYTLVKGLTTHIKDNLTKEILNEIEERICKHGRN